MRVSKFKFANGNVVVGIKLSPFHRIKGFKDKEALTIYQQNRRDTENQKLWGLWVKSPKGDDIRLQDLNGNVTGHGDYFELFEVKK
jgi:hypothetical protein